MAARCPNCTRKVHLWSNYTGFCSKRCREESRSSCLNCGKVGLYKHERLGCCSDECRFWYVTTMLGYDREYLLTPAWDKVVYHVRLPSGNAEISSLQLDELEFERAHETILVVAAPAWISRQKVLAELPYQRFDNPAWRHLRADATLSPEELERFRAMCYDDPLLYHKLGQHVHEKIRGLGGTSPITPPSTVQLAPGGVPLQPMVQVAAASMPMAQLPETAVMQQAPMLPTPTPLQLTEVSQAGAMLPAPEHFAAQVRTLFALRNYQVSTINGDTVNTLLLTKGDKRAVAIYLWQVGMVSGEPVQRLLEMMTAWEASHGYVVTNGHFTLQAEDLVAGRPVQLIDGPELTALIDRLQATPADSSATFPAASPEANTAPPGGPLEGAAETTRLRDSTVALNGDTRHLEQPGESHPAQEMAPIAAPSLDDPAPMAEPVASAAPEASTPVAEGE